MKKKPLYAITAAFAAVFLLTAAFTGCAAPKDTES